MERTFSLLTRLRTTLAKPRLILFFAIAYIISQAAIIYTVCDIGPGFLKLQLTAFDAKTYRETFSAWQDAGWLEAYKAHLTYDHFHGLWYAGLATTVLCSLFQKLNVKPRWNWLLLLPVVSALCDCFENGMQEMFLAGDGFANIVDPWPRLSAYASITKWSLVAVYVGVIDGLLIRWGALFASDK